MRWSMINGMQPKPTKKRFCKYCGGEIDSNKKCTKCGKQFFHLPRISFLKTFLCILFFAIALLSSVTAATFYIECQNISAKLETAQTEISSLKQQRSQQKAKNVIATKELEKYKTMYLEQKTIADYWQKYMSIITESEDKYHKCTCPYIQNSNWTRGSTLVWMVEGYEPCSFCYNDKDQPE